MTVPQLGCWRTQVSVWAALAVWVPLAVLPGVTDNLSASSLKLFTAAEPTCILQLHGCHKEDTQVLSSHQRQPISVLIELFCTP